MRLKVEFTGPFFTKDIKRTMRQNGQAMLRGMAAEGESAVKAQLGAQGSVKRLGGVVGQMQSLTGKRWDVTMAIHSTYKYPWANAGSGEYKGGKLEGRYHAFRRVASALRRSAKIARADLTKGLN